MPSHFRKRSSSWIGAAIIAVLIPAMHSRAQPTSSTDGPGNYPIECSIQSASGMQECGQQPITRSCDAEANYASRPSQDSAGIVFVNRGDKPVKIYWLNFQGQRVLYNPNLPPAARHAQQTFVGHNWVVTTLTEQCLDIFTTDPPPITADEAVAMAPPEMLVDEQPPPPGDNFVWTPGYWSWNADISDYYWVPGIWVSAPIVGYAWTPGYWVTERGLFHWRAGYWGPHVGFYGGIYYGWGYFGHGFVGSSWRDGRVIYNSAATNVGHLNSANVYYQPVVNNTRPARLSYNGPGGISSKPNSAELSAAAEYHLPSTAAQLQRTRAAHDTTALRASLSTGRTSLASSAVPGGSASAVFPTAQHSGTLSVIHSTPPPPPPRPVSITKSSKAASAPSTAAASDQSQRGAPLQPAQAARVSMEKQSAPQEAQQVHQPSTKPQPPAVSHTVGHSP
jgi:VHL beta domain/WXXGXW repeat (2 copies)